MDERIDAKKADYNLFLVHVACSCFHPKKKSLLIMNLDPGIFYNSDR